MKRIEPTCIFCDRCQPEAKVMFHLEDNPAGICGDCTDAMVAMRAGIESTSPQLAGKGVSMLEVLGHRRS